MIRLLKKQLSGILCFLMLSVGFSAMAQRQNLDFNQDWQFFKPLNNTYKVQQENGKPLKLPAGIAWEEVDLPHTYNAEDMQLDRNFYTGDGVYRKVFSVPDNSDDKRLFLYFEGVGSVAKIYINGQYLGEHKGGYSMFSFEITNSVNFDKPNELVVVANNEARKDVLPVNQFLFPIYGGIYRPVHLIVTEKTNFTATDYASSGVYIQQHNVSAKQAEIQVQSKIETVEKELQEIQIETKIIDHNDKVVARTADLKTVSPQGFTAVTQNLKLRRPHLWDGINDPYLYTVEVSIRQNGRLLDQQTEPLGVRSIELKAGDGVYLNGKKYPMYGVTRHQDEWGYGSALSFKQHKRDMELIKEIGATTIRLAHYQQSREMYALADTLGLLVWAEIPFVNAVSYEESANAKQQMTELVKQNYNHPSIYIWGMHNEVYNKTPDQQVHTLTKQLNDIAKTLDPQRLTTAVNGFGTMDRPENLAGDVQGMNRYYGWYEGKIEDLETWADGLAKNYPNYKLMLTEYGADGNIDQQQEIPQKPKNVVSGDYFPESYQTETHIQQWAIIEKHPNILASYLWNMFEFAVPMWNRGGVNARNLKGLITFDRKRKKDAFYWYKANWNPEPMLYLANRRDKDRTHKTTKIQAFSNLKNVRFEVNGKVYEAQQGVNDKHWVVENVSLQKGKNIIKAFSSDQNDLTDEMEWFLE